MAIPRSTALTAVALNSVCRTSANLTVSSIAAGATTTFTQAVPRGFQPNAVVKAMFPNGLQAGLIVGTIFITGNSPSTGAATKGYTANIPITNTTAGALTPTAGPIFLTQD